MVPIAATSGETIVSTSAFGAEAVAQLKKSRQTRRYEDRPVPDEIVQDLLEVARWTGSSINTQPWHFVVIEDKKQLRELSEIIHWIDWLADAPMAIAIVLDGKNPAVEGFDEGRVTERLLLAARFLGLGGGTAWLGDDAQQAQGREILGVPDGYIARSVVAIGYPERIRNPTPNPALSGRRPLSELVSYGTFGSGE